MKQSTYDIFISYRRAGGAQYARILQLMLNQRGYKVFLDYDELTDGKFGEHIRKAIHESPIFMLVLSKGALERCKNEGDWLRREIQLAISEEKQIIPVNPDNSFDGVPEDIPEDIKEEVSSHQHSDINFGQTLGVTVDYMVTTRIEPKIGKRTRLDNDIDYLNSRLAAEDKARKRHRLFMKSIMAVGVLCIIGIIGVIGHSIKSNSDEIHKRQNLMAQVERHHPGLDFMSNDSITIEQLEVIDNIFNNMRDVYGDSIRFSAFETTVSEYYTILGEKYDKAQAILPISNVSFGDALKFIEKLNNLINSKKTNIEFDLPTKEEWEFAALNGDLTKQSKYAGSDVIDEVAWYANNSENKRHSADGQNQLKPNELGLYDMSGNVSEYVFTPFTDARNPERLTNMMLVKGGDYKSQANECTVDYDFPIDIDMTSDKIGFRLVLRKTK